MSPHLTLAELETPVPVVDLDVLERNVERLADYATHHGLRLRPHIKTHKASVIGARQLEHGAIGLTCATTRETEVMAGITDDVLVAYPPIGDRRVGRLAALPRTTRLMVAVDSTEAVMSLGRAARDAGRSIRVLVELDLGMRRVGVSDVSEGLRLVKSIQDQTALEFAGVMFYPGHIRDPLDRQTAALERLASDVREWIRELERADAAPGIVSGGSTPTAFRSHEVPGLTEIRPGTYVYNDRDIVAIGAAEREDCALTVLATVVSTAVAAQAVVDAGTKALGREPLRTAQGAGFGELLDHPEVTVKSMSEEHGILDLSGTSWKPRIGEQVRIIPNHVCIVTHLNDRAFGVRGEAVETSWVIEARGRAIDR